MAASTYPRLAPRPLPPGPRTPSLVNAIRFARDPHAYIRSVHSRYGSVFTVRFVGAGPVVWAAEPGLVRQILTGDSELLHGGEAAGLLLEPLFGNNSVATLDGEPHMRRRKLILPAFHGDRVRRWAKDIQELVERDLETWPVNTVFTLRPHTQWITRGVILRVVLGLQDEERFRRAQLLVAGLARRLDPIMLFRFTRHSLGPWSPWARFKRARGALDSFIYEEIALRRREASLAQRNDVLSLLLGAKDTDGRTMSDRELRDELTDLIFTGYDGPGTALDWAFERLLRNHQVLEQLKRSLTEGDDYLDATIKEVLRMRPIGPIGRRLTRDIEMAGYRIPAGAFVAPAMAALHYRADIYPEPEEFRPERFLNGGPKSYAWIPFGGGVRRCIGAALGQLEMRVAIRTILERAELRAPDRAPERSRIRMVVSTPARDCRVVLTQPLRPARREP
jgi:cytochrome P450